MKYEMNCSNYIRNWKLALQQWDNWTNLKKHYKVFHMAMRHLSAFKCDECNREFNTAKQYK